MYILFFIGVIVSCLGKSESVNNVMCTLSDSKTIYARPRYDRFDDWSFRMIQDIGEHIRANIVYGPYSMAMFIAELAVIDDTYRKQLAPALRLSRLFDEDIDNQRNYQLKRFHKSGRSNLKSPNELFLLYSKTGSAIERRCKARKCNLHVTDLGDVGFPKGFITDWFKQQTKSNILNVQHPKLYVSSVATNVAIFSGEWLHKFDPTKTRQREFFSSTEKTKKVDMMYAHGFYNFGNLPDYDATFIMLPFKISDQEATDMYIILPNQMDGLDSLRKNLYNVITCAKFPVRVSREMHVYLPAFNLKNTIDLGALMERTGVDKGFFMGPHFRKGKTLPIVQRIIHGAYINVNENGVNTYPSVRPKYQKQQTGNGKILGPSFNVNRPFVWVILSSRGSPLLSGTYMEPVRYI